MPGRPRISFSLPVDKIEPVNASRSILEHQLPESHQAHLLGSHHHPTHHHPSPRPSCMCCLGWLQLPGTSCQPSERICFAQILGVQKLMQREDRLTRWWEASQKAKDTKWQLQSSSGLWFTNDIDWHHLTIPDHGVVKLFRRTWKRWCPTAPGLPLQALCWWAMVLGPPSESLSAPESLHVGRYGRYGHDSFERSEAHSPAKYESSPPLRHLASAVPRVPIHHKDRHTMWLPICAYTSSCVSHLHTLTKLQKMLPSSHCNGPWSQAANPQ